MSGRYRFNLPRLFVVTSALVAVVNGESRNHPNVLFMGEFTALYIWTILSFQICTSIDCSNPEKSMYSNSEDLSLKLLTTFASTSASTRTTLTWRPSRRPTCTPQTLMPLAGGELSLTGWVGKHLLRGLNRDTAQKAKSLKKVYLKYWTYVYRKGSAPFGGLNIFS